VQDAEVIVDTTGRDWVVEAGLLNDVPSLRDLYAQAAHAGAAGDIGTAIARRGAEIERAKP
jgi:hypothetical protein